LARNTAPAVAAVALDVVSRYPDHLLVIAPRDWV
jgi:mannose-1-phosphate guanylyltransferase